MPYRGSPACVNCDSEYECKTLCAAGVSVVKDVEIAALKAEVERLGGTRVKSDLRCSSCNKKFTKTNPNEFSSGA